MKIPSMGMVALGSATRVKLFLNLRSPVSYPRYSIVIPAYNEAARIIGALESVVACVRAARLVR